MRICLRIYFIILLIIYCGHPLRSQCFVSNVSIPPAVTTAERVLEIDVQGLTPSDLATDQELCLVFLEFDHGRIANVRMTLTSPAGQSVTLIGPGITGGGVSPLVKWNITQVRCSDPTIPDAGFSSQWDNDQPWASLTNYTGTYHPQAGCLEDFNMGSALGTWKLSIENLGNNSGELIYFSLVFCNGAPSDCVTCSPYASDLGDQSYQFCEGIGLPNDVEFQVPPELGATDTLLFFVENSSSQFVSELGNLAFLPAGSSTICPVVLPQSAVSFVAGSATSVQELELIADDPQVCMDVGGCVDVEVYPFENVSLQNFLICAGDTVEFNGEIYTESIDTFIAVGSITVPCSDSIQLSIVVEDISVSLDPSVSELVCGQSALLDATGSTVTPGPVTQYNWTTVDGNFLLDVGPIAQVDQAGTYLVEVMTDNCSALDSIILTSSDTFYIQLEQMLQLCPADPLTIAVTDSIPPSGVPTTFTITAATGPVGSSTDIMGTSIFVSEPGLYTVQTTAGSCVSENQIVVIESLTPPFTVDLSADTLTCDQTMVPLLLDTDIPNPVPDFSGPETIPAGSVDPLVSTPGTYYVTVLDGNLCAYTDSIIVVFEGDTPVLSLMDQDFDCDAPMADRLLVSSVDRPVDYSWSGPMFSSEESAPTIMEGGVYNLTVTGNNGCTSAATAMITIINRDFDFEVDSLVLPCDKDSILICARDFELSDTLLVEWSDVSGGNTLLSETACFYLSGAGEYSCTVETVGGCVAVKNFVAEDLSESLSLSIEATPENLGCEVSSLTLKSIYSAGSDGDFLWFLDGVEQVQYAGLEEIVVTEAGTYTVELAFRNGGCILEASHVVAEDDQSLQVDLGPDLVMEVGEQVMLDALIEPFSDDLILEWQSADNLSCGDCPDPVLTAVADETLILVVTDSLGCTASDTLQIDIEDPILTETDSSVYYIPTIFQKGLTGNDALAIGVNPDRIEAFEIRIYDRWGHLMMERTELITDNQMVVWDGTRNGQSVEAGVYVYMAVFLHIDGLEEVSVGTITLIK